MTSKRTQVVMLPTKEKAQVGMIVKAKSSYNKLYTIGLVWAKHLNTNNTNGTLIKQHLYFLSDEEIKEGDWFFHNNKIINATNAYIDLLNKKSINGKKIIATTDSSLKIINGYINSQSDNLDEPFPNYTTLPQPSQDFIKVFIEEYNKGNIIEWVNVEYECLVSAQLHLIDFGKNTDEIVSDKKCIETRLKINSKNEITIKKIKDNLKDLIKKNPELREEVEKLIIQSFRHVNKYFKYTSSGNYRTADIDSYAKKWISKNL